jgi:hypothetical protein
VPPSIEQRPSGLTAHRLVEVTRTAQYRPPMLACGCFLAYLSDEAKKLHVTRHLSRLTGRN